MSGLFCHFCGEDLLPHQAYLSVTAWEKPQYLRGESGSSLVLRRTTGQAACNECITKLRHGVPPTQSSLFA